jgi:uncharacterized protein YndB with AHSA1/START domain
MELRFSVSGRIARPVNEVFEAVVDPTKLSHYFTTGGAKGRLETGATVQWDFADFPGAFPVRVGEVEKNKRIVLYWAAADGSDPMATGEAPQSAGYDTKVTMTFEALADGRTLVTISEEGWRESEAGLKACLGNCHGWTQMLCSLKAWLEHGINLREGMYK